MNKVTLNKDGTPRRKGSGRTKGSVSFTNIQLKELKKVCGDETVIPVSRKWLETMGFSLETPTAKPKIASVAPLKKSEDRVQFTIS
jgi:hypothetical protein